MAYLRIVLLCLIIVTCTFCDLNEQIHEYMSPEEIKEVFNTDSNSVPKYELVNIDMSEELGKNDHPTRQKMHLKVFGENIDAWLHPKKSVLLGEGTPVYLARHAPDRNPGNVTFMHLRGIMQTMGKSYGNSKQWASFVIGTEHTGKGRLNGYIGSKKIVVKSLPPRVAEEYRRRRRSVDDYDDFYSNYHIAFKINETNDEDYTLPINHIKLRRSSRSVSKIPKTIYPEILVILDHSMFRRYQGNVYKILEYLLAFWNGVDLKFRSLKSPRVRLHISAIIIAEDPLATPYMSNFASDDNAFNSTLAMRKVGTFLNDVTDTFPKESYDISCTMTTLNFGLGHDATLGKAWVGQACSHSNPWPNNMNSNAIFKDNGVFHSIHVAAHELGHLLGAPHDWSKDGCNYTYGFIMSAIPYYTSNSSDFSPCSLRAIEKLLNENELDCLFNRPKTPWKSLSRLMPGRLMNLDKQCKALDKGNSCESADPDICLDIKCLNPQGRNCWKSGIAALDGTTCMGNKFCLHMKCVSL